MDGVSVKRVQEGKAIILTCRDEKHRQQVFKNLKQQRKRAQVEVKIQCWLSHLQRCNKTEVYKWAQQIG